MPNTTFALSRFRNRTGTSSWRVSGWLAGVRIRKNFKFRKEVEAEKLVFQTRFAQLDAGVRSATTFLTDEQLRDAEAAFRQRTDRPESLGFYLNFAMASYRPPERWEPLAEAVAEYLAGKRQEHTQGD